MSLYKLLKEGETLTLLSPVPFDCVVQGKPLTATLTAIQDNYIQYFYHLSFSDGYASAFVSAEGYGWGDSALNPTYVIAIEKDLEAIACHHFDTPIFCFSYPFIHKSVNIWVLEGNYSEDEVYHIFFNGQQQFIIVKAENGYGLITPPNQKLHRATNEVAAAAIEKITALKTAV